MAEHWGSFPFSWDMTFSTYEGPQSICSYTEAITETGKYHNTKNASGQEHLLRFLFSLPRIRNLKSKLLVLCFCFSSQMLRVLHIQITSCDPHNQPMNYPHFKWVHEDPMGLKCPQSQSLKRPDQYSDQVCHSKANVLSPHTGSLPQCAPTCAPRILLGPCMPLPSLSLDWSFKGLLYCWPTLTALCAMSGSGNITNHREGPSL